MTTKHGTRTAYLAGCRCDPCKLAQSTYRKQNRAQKTSRPASTASTVTALPTRSSSAGVSSMGKAEEAVLAELGTLTSAETRLGAVQSALALARVLDNPNAGSSGHVQAAKALPAILEDLRKGSARRKGRLASVQAITKSASA